ncbi:DUF317 domain-containing protein [Streptomyces lasiicapitis]|uniref:DUF317 domain-containing protein n=1 Tax=Streptomyces lasiicapitis TaxID=1923961 RepID=UPI0033188698
MQFDAFAAQQANSPLPTWTVWGGHAVHQPDWAMQLSANTPAALVQHVTFEMAEGQGRQLMRPATPAGAALRTTPVPALVAAAPLAARLPRGSR